MSPNRVAAFLLFALLPPAWGQFEVRTVDAAGERAAPPVCNLGWIYPGETISAAFRVRNVSSAAATLDFLEAAGTGFHLTTATQLPVSLASQQALDFTVRFQASAPGSYSAALRGNGISAILIATVQQRLTYRVESDAGSELLTGAVDFGAVERGATATRRITVENQMTVLMTVPAIAAAGAGFSVLGTPPSGVVLRPGETTAFEVAFRPEADAPGGALSGVLTIGDRSYPLKAAVADPPPPTARISINLGQAQSAQQGVVTVKFEAAARAAGSGTVTLDLLPTVAGATDPTIAFASGGRTAAFTFNAGDSEARFGTQAGAAFQTGTTSGTLVFTTELGGVTDRQSVVIPASAISVASASAVRQANGIEVQIAGFDNTRTAGQLAFTFFDEAGKALTPGGVRADASAAFAGYFPTSGLGGAFLMKAVFPVSGDASQIASFSVEMSNSAGATTIARTRF